MVSSAALRATMIDSQLRTNDVNDARLLDAVAEIPRERFVPSEKKSLAYMSEPIETAKGRYLLDPRSFGKLMQAAAIGPDDVVLVAGGGNGYMAAVAAKLASTVVALECEADMAAAAEQAFADLGLDNIAVIKGPLEKGRGDQGPYDVILINGGVEEVPPVLFDQLKEGGRLAAIVVNGPAGKGHLYVKAATGLSRRIVFDATVPLLPGFTKAREFTF